MADRSLLDEMMADELVGASREQKFAAKLATLSDREFADVSDFLCNLGDQAKREAAVAPPEQTDIEHAISEMSDADLAELTPDQPGLGSHRLQPTLSQSMTAHRRKLESNE